ncbi:MAG: hypothetical protein CMH46_05620 [Muricauda sp.]|nr:MULTISPECIES: hypothetical protein [unclassified Allomuricauda]MAU15002.1 hypothetical protein [Allomuricauda sp.]|tara:strand:+ start:3839 stop:5002 length:1164 start_codon:yes stop_codon:yes gene_type:complete
MMKIKNIKARFVLLFAIIGFLAPSAMHAQFFKKLKKNVEDRVVEVAGEKSDQLLNGETETTVNDNVKTGTDTKTTPTETTVKKVAPSPQDQEVLRFKAPSKDFRDIVIQAYKGLPRYGELNFKNGTNALITNNAYKALLELKFLEDTFKDMDRSKLTKHKNTTGDLAKKNSEFSQNHLRILAGETLSVEKLKEYFCDSETPSSCSFYNRAGERIFVSYWGGTSKNEFAQNRSYTTFVKEYFDTLKNWSQTFYTDGSEVVYYVAKGLVAEKYDFKEKGYWIGNLFSIGGDFILHQSNFLAYTENEKAIRYQGKKIFLPMDADKAKTYKLIPRSPVFVVFKVLVNPKPNNTTSVKWEYELESPILEIYKDVTLTDKMGEVDINSTNLKN